MIPLKIAARHYLYILHVTLSYHNNLMVYASYYFQLTFAETEALDVNFVNSTQLVRGRARI